jgi:hypothetical protein
MHRAGVVRETPYDESKHAYSTKRRAQKLQLVIWRGCCMGPVEVHNFQNSCGESKYVWCFLCMVKRFLGDAI